MAKKTNSFESAMDRLKEIVQTLENGEAPLEETLKLYEEGVLLVRSCTERLEQAEQKVKMLQLGSDGTMNFTDFTQGEI